MRPVEFQPAARSDLLDIHGYLSREASESIAERFFAAIESTVNKLAEHPGAGRPRDLRSPRLRDLRSHRVQHFHNYLIFYVVEPSAIVIVRVLHAKRDWEAQVNDSDW